jgi:hypothetical protein
VKQIEFLNHAIGVLGRLEIPYAIVGSYASSAWGEPRMTRDIDILIQLSPDQIEQFCGEFPAPDFYVSQAAATEAFQCGSQFNIIHPASGNKIDFMLGASRAQVDPQLERRQLIEIAPNVSGYVAAAEDVILGKLTYYREGGSEKHLRDIKGILKVSGQAIDRDYIGRHASQLGLSDFWQSILNDPK